MELSSLGTFVEPSFSETFVPRTSIPWNFRSLTLIITEPLILMQCLLYRSSCGVAVIAESADWEDLHRQIDELQILNKQHIKNEGINIIAYPHSKPQILFSSSNMSVNCIGADSAINATALASNVVHYIHYRSIRDSNRSKFSSSTKLTHFAVLLVNCVNFAFTPCIIAQLQFQTRTPAKSLIPQFL